MIVFSFTVFHQPSSQGRSSSLTLERERRKTWRSNFSASGLNRPRFEVDKKNITTKSDNKRPLPRDYFFLGDTWPDPKPGSLLSRSRGRGETLGTRLSFLRDLQLAFANFVVTTVFFLYNFPREISSRDGQGDVWPPVTRHASPSLHTSRQLNLPLAVLQSRIAVSFSTLPVCPYVIVLNFDITFQFKNFQSRWPVGFEGESLY